MMRYEGKVCPPPEDAGMIGLVVAKFNRNITERLLSGALTTLRQHHVPDQKIRIFWVPGAFEIPHIAARLLQTGDYAAVICLGAVIKGDTDHHLYINQSVSSSLSWLQTASDTPVIFGILTCDTIEQALARCGGATSAHDKTVDPAAGHKGIEAAEAALEMLDLISEIPIAPPINAQNSQQSNSLMRRNVNDNDDESDSEKLCYEVIRRDPHFLQKFHSFVQQLGLLDDDEDENDGCDDDSDMTVLEAFFPRSKQAQERKHAKKTTKKTTKKAKKPGRPKKKKDSE